MQIHIYAIIMNKDLKSSSFSDGAKIALVRPMFKKKSRNQVENYGPVSILNEFSKICEKYIDNSLIPFEDNFFSFSYLLILRLIAQITF